jgi:hypothetical protein
MTKFKKTLSKQADLQYERLKNNPSNKKIFKAVEKALKYLMNNPKHQSLGTHIFHSLTGAHEEKVFVAYAQQNTPGAYRILWHYGPDKNEITIVAIIPHPNH